MNRHGRVFSLRFYFQVFRVLPSGGWNSKVEADSGDAAAAFLFWSLYLHPATQQTVVKFLELRQFLPDPGFNSFRRMGVTKLDL